MLEYVYCYMYISAFIKKCYIDGGGVVGSDVLEMFVRC